MDNQRSTALPPPLLDNVELSGMLLEVADLLEAQQANPFRVRAYRNAAQTVTELPKPVSELLDADGLDGLVALPGIGKSLAASIERVIRLGRLPLLEQLRGNAVSERVFTTVGGIGPELAARIHHDLGIETLAELQEAAWNGSLNQIRGMGKKRVASIRESLAGRFRLPIDAEKMTPKQTTVDQPPVEELLDIDRQYRKASAEGRLTKIAPKRFNPEGTPWLPILHTHREDRHYTALFSNTAHAHEMQTTHDWVVIYRDDHFGHGQWTIITSRLGDLKGQRIVRGREAECRQYYKHHNKDEPNLSIPQDDLAKPATNSS